jgi:hypothetical protein
MSWSTVPFGKYQGKTFPEIIVNDLDWFFWVVPKLYGRIAQEAQDLAQKARAIKVPNQGRKHLEVEYRYEMGNRFCGFGLVEADNARYSRWATRLPYLDLSWPLRRKKYDKRAGRVMIRDFRIHYFGEHKRLTKERCEEFFSNDRNFIDT